jgi:hypothetical protein
VLSLSLGRGGDRMAVAVGLVELSLSRVGIYLLNVLCFEWKCLL